MAERRLIVRVLAGPRPSPQNPDRVLREDLRAQVWSPMRVRTTLAQTHRSDPRRPHVAPRIEDIRNPDDRRLRYTLVNRARLAREASA